MTYEFETVSNERDKVLRGTTPIAWISLEEKPSPAGPAGMFAPAVRVYVVHRYDERGPDKRGARVGERFSHHGAFELAVNACG